MKAEINIVLVISAPNVRDPEATKILVCSEQEHVLPWATLLKDKDCRQTAVTLLEWATTLRDDGFTKITFSGMRDEPTRCDGDARLVTMVYSVLLPEAVPFPTTPCEWVGVRELHLDEDQVQSLHVAACGRL